MRPTSLHQQLMRASMLTTFVAILLSAGALLAYELTIYRNAWVADLRTQAELIARSTAAALEVKDNKAARENLLTLKSQPRIQAAAVYGANGELIAVHTTDPSAVWARMAVDLPTWGPRFRGATLEMTQPIERDGTRLGTLYLKARHDVWSRLSDFAWIVLVVSALSLALAFYLFGRLRKRATAPLEKMTDIAQEVIESHNWALRAPETHYKDLGVLVNAFNRMLSECETRTRELEREMVTRHDIEQELRQADRHKDEFLATLAHELRNPLSPMTSAVALLRMPTASVATRDKALVVLDRQLKHIVRLINDLLDASRMATGKLSLERELLDVGELLSTVTEGVVSLADQHGLQLSLHLPRRTLCVEGDSVRLTQVFSNLLSNACRYTRRGGQVKVTLAEEGLWVRIHVSDTGIGVEPAMQERIFNLFEQADKTLARGSAGLGVGLTLSRQIIELHQGTLSMSSAGLDQGSCFTVSLPRLDCGVRDGQEAAATGATPVRPLRILVADDNVDLADNFSEILRAVGHDVETVYDGEAAVRAAQEHVPDIALLDIGMPGLNGYDVARRLRANLATCGVHLVAITGWGAAEDKDAAKQAGFDHHLLKPVASEDLERILRNTFEAFQASRPGDLI
ncbi:hybrid sensor histidine kinase/response regulator [Hydrogenophaga sp.]|uniref:hybrid sensor histidine kinase/response regulator n=1 Tax=Hydrogenophaga sp. TaxID=1904254 RepID=UPI002FC89683